MVAGLERQNALADFHNNARPLVSEHGWKNPLRVGARQGKFIGVADAGALISTSTSPAWAAQGQSSPPKAASPRRLQWRLWFSLFQSPLVCFFWIIKQTKEENLISARQILIILRYNFFP